MVMILVMHGQLAHSRAAELAPAARADPWVQFECLLAIRHFAFTLVATGFGQYAVEF